MYHVEVDAVWTQKVINELSKYQWVCSADQKLYTLKRPKSAKDG